MLHRSFASPGTEPCPAPPCLQLPVGKDEFAIMLTQDYVAALRRSKAAVLHPPASGGSQDEEAGGSSVAAAAGGPPTAAAQQAAQVRGLCGLQHATPCVHHGVFNCLLFSRRLAAVLTAGTAPPLSPAPTSPSLPWPHLPGV